MVNFLRGFTIYLMVRVEVAASTRTILPARSCLAAEKLALDLETGRLPHEDLSDREFQVMCMIARSKTLKNIGEELYLSTKTVVTYRSRLLEKMKMKSNEELTRYAMNNRLID